MNIANQPKYPFILPELPYDKSALAPYLTDNSFNFHHGKHHAAYVTNLNNLIKDNSDYNILDLEEVIAKSAKEKEQGIFNNAAQIWNHTFYWHCMKQNGGGEPTGALLTQINKDFGGMANFKEEFKKAGTTQFGSGWAWLVYDGVTLIITKTANADLPIIRDEHPILTCDVWEHAYYLDYQNRRPDYLGVFLDNLVNWDFASANFAEVM